MIDQLLSWDREVFFAINQGLSNAVFDWLMPILRNKYAWAPLYLFIIVFCIRNYKRKGIAVILFILITFGISDHISSSVIKNSVQRVRPCRDVELKDDIIVRVNCSGGYSFTSSHATNHFAMAVFLILVFYRRWKHILWIGLLWAGAISFAQVYVGVHYPLDIICGAILGTLIGCLTGLLFRFIIPDLTPAIKAS
ncbi:undecaprenyl-diphosphatase [Parapedobacter composti]|uniref:Undecaprenyl-diphosphatase n=1 Tax=Parapedobacter composti TaxID=623281 RepID=A0A1I1KR67_9SPHI|nr:phosphatase PAP2 family protein [Parapedobacter composti]SFC61178.1 undecaprenyl-diphosphatase [Parapedobacter composti]